MKKSLHKYEFKLIHGRCKVYINSLLHLSFNQEDFIGLYSYRDDRDRYGLDIHLKGTIIEVWYESRQIWEEILKLLDKNL